MILKNLAFRDMPLLQVNALNEFISGSITSEIALLYVEDESSVVQSQIPVGAIDETTLFSRFFQAN